MNTFRFTFTIADETVCSNEMAEAIFEAGGDDASVGSRDGSVFVHFDREAESLDDAIRSAIRVLATAGLAVAHAEIDDDTLKLLTA